MAIGRGDQGVTYDDINRALESAQAITVPNNREIIHVIPRHFQAWTSRMASAIPSACWVSGWRCRRTSSLAQTTAMQNQLKCAHGAGVDVAEFVLTPLASAEAVLTPTEREMGVVLVDIGGGTTDIAVFIEGAAWHTKVLDVGGSHFTSDLAHGAATADGDGRAAQGDLRPCQPD